MPLDTSEPLPIPPFAAVENFGQAIGFLRRPPKKGLCEWVNNCGQAVASTYAGGSSEILKLAMGKPADDLVLEDFNCAWEYWKMAFRQVWDIYKLEEETDRGDGSHFEAFVEAWVFYMAYETKLLVKRARGEHVTPSDSEVENKEELFNRRLLELVAPLDDENFLDSINRMTPERAGEAVTGINALISMVTNHSLDSLELTDFTCNCQARNMLFHDVWLQFHLKHVADRSTGIFPAFKKAWLQYIQQEKALFGMRRDGEVLDEGEEATAEDFGSQAMAVIEEAPTVLDASSIQTINGFSPKFATRAVRSRKRKLRFYEKVLSGEEQMERRHIVGLVGTVSRFKEFWDELDPADEGAVHELVRDLKTRIEVEVGALEKRGTGGLVEGEKVEGPEDLVVKFFVYVRSNCRRFIK